MLYARVFSVSAESLRVGVVDVHGIELCGEENEENKAKSAFFCSILCTARYTKSTKRRDFQLKTHTLSICTRGGFGGALYGRLRPESGVVNGIVAALVN